MCILYIHTYTCVYIYIYSMYYIYIHISIQIVSPYIPIHIIYPIQSPLLRGSPSFDAFCWCFSGKLGAKSPSNILGPSAGPHIGVTSGQ